MGFEPRPTLLTSLGCTVSISVAGLGREIGGGVKGFDSIIKVFYGKLLCFCHVFETFKNNLGNKPYGSLGVIRHDSTALHLDAT